VTKIERNIRINAPKDVVWRIISDLKNEAEYWYGTKEVKTISTSDSKVEREITQNFRNHKILQEAILHGPNSVEIFYLKGLTEGKKTMTIEEISDSELNLKVLWDVHFSGIYWLATPFIARHTSSGTENALKRIKSAAENIREKT
jgi:hypothetical protein